MTATGTTSWAGFAREIFSCAGLDVTVEGISSEEYPTPAARPRNSRLDCTQLARIHGVRLPHWRESLATVVTRLMEKHT